MNTEPWVYVAWIRDHQYPVGDEDDEWVAVMLVFADSAGSAQAWGDLLIRKNRDNGVDEFLWSEVHTQQDPRYGNSTDWEGVPVTHAGSSAPEDQIDW